MEKTHDVHVEDVKQVHTNGSSDVAASEKASSDEFVHERDTPVSKGV